MKNGISIFLAAGLLVLAAGFVNESRAAETKKGLQFGGSLRGRYDLIHYLTDASGSTRKQNRGRIRYRLRLDAKATLNPHSQFYGRLVSGSDSRSGNVTLGSPVDFGPTEITIRYAALVLTPWSGGVLPGGKGQWSFDFGRVKNSYRWKGHGKDMMLWDGDLALAGAGTQFSHQLGGNSHFFVKTGYYQFDENKSLESSDPYMTPFQGGLIFGGESTRAGIRGTLFHMDELDAAFIQRGVDGTDGVTSSGGNVSDGLTGDANGGKLQVIETQAFFGFDLGSVPMNLSGGYSNNNSAAASLMQVGVAKNSVAYNFQLEAGSKKKALLAGVGWYHIEANAFPSQFIDSDLLDGHTNREGLLFFLAKTILKDADLGLQFYRSDAIDTHPSLGESVKNSKRNRLMIDLLYKF